MDDGEGGRLSFVGKRVSPAFEKREFSFSPGESRPYDEAEWRDALVVVERGEIHLEGLNGEHLCLRRGAVVWLCGLSLVALHNRGQGAAVVVAVARRRRPDDGDNR